MGVITENMPQGSSRNKIEYLAECMENGLSEAGAAAVYPLNRAAFMNFKAGINQLDEYGRIQYLPYTNYSGNHIANELYLFDDDGYGYIGVGMAATLIASEQGQAWMNDQGVIQDRVKQARLEFDLTRALSWEPYETATGTYIMAFYGENAVSMTVNGVVWEVGNTVHGEWIFKDGDDNIETLVDGVSPKAFAAAEVGLIYDVNDNFGTYFNACLFPLTIQFKLEVTFPAGTSAPTASDMIISLYQIGGYDNEHWFPYKWDDATKKMTVYGSLTDCQSYMLSSLMSTSDYMTEYEKTGAQKLSFECGDLDFSAVTAFSMEGGIAIHGAEPWTQGAM